MSHFVFNRPVGGWGKSTEKSKGCRYVQFIYHVHQFPRVISGGSIFPSFPCSLGWNRTLLGGLPSPGEMSSWESTVNPCPFVRKTEIKRKAVATVVPAGMAPACQAARAFQQLGKSQAAAPSPAHQLHLCKKSASSTMCQVQMKCAVYLDRRKATMAISLHTMYALSLHNSFLAMGRRHMPSLV